ncbi:MAG: hypothetical protein Q9173_003140 [Seirophora scorigena]
MAAPQYARNPQFGSMRSGDWLLLVYCVVRILAITRFACRPSQEYTDAVLSSPRYRSCRENIYHPVSRSDFSGYWFIQDTLINRKPPSTSDVTIFYLHGGGYICSQPAHYLLFSLRLAEAVLDRGLTVSIFALDYSLAPE